MVTGEQIERIYGESRSAGATEFIGAVEYDPERDRFEAYSTHSGRRGPLFAEDLETSPV